MHSVPYPYLTLALAIWAAVGPLIGIFYGNVLSRSAQHEQWVRDRRNEEWRELLTALAESLRATLKIYPGAVLDSDDQRIIVETEANCFRVIRDRIFIARDVVLLNIENRWSAAVTEHHQTFDTKKLGAMYVALRDEIVAAATDKNLKHRYNLIKGAGKNVPPSGRF